MQLESVQSCHDQNFLHRDVKADNFLFVIRVIRGKRAVRLALNDFGRAFKIDSKGAEYMKQMDLIDVFETVNGLTGGFTKEPLRGYYQELLKLDEKKDPRALIKRFIKELRGKKSESRIIVELTRFYPRLGKRGPNNGE